MKRSRFSTLLRAGALSACAALSLAITPAGAADIDCGDGPLIVFAAASMTDAVGEIANAYTEQTGCAAAVSAASSSTLARQIAEGAPADVYVSPTGMSASFMPSAASISRVSFRGAR